MLVAARILFTIICMTLCCPSNACAQNKIVQDDGSNDASGSLRSLIDSKLKLNGIITTAEYSQGELTLRVANPSSIDQASLIKQVSTITKEIEESLELSPGVIKNIVIKKSLDLPRGKAKKASAPVAPIPKSVDVIKPNVADVQQSPIESVVKPKAISSPEAGAITNEPASPTLNSGLGVPMTAVTQASQHLVDEYGRPMTRRDQVLGLAYRQLRNRDGWKLMQTADHLYGSAGSNSERATAMRLKALGYFFQGDEQQAQYECARANAIDKEVGQFVHMLEQFQGNQRIRFSQLMRSAVSQNMTANARFEGR